ncbi:MAG: peptide chain release factor 1 [Acetobacteraceae bacterium]|nr:peptide chain release factor 1 [Acetobacteraceae bacterium]MSP30804.1 peptide chain release factor 1 [Acetobacteraceae bacterium]
MTELEYARKLAELDRLLNDPEVPMRPGDVWDLLAEISQQDLAVVPAQAAA